jgi:WhiB family transcriptional regulator, redox-sensing transcriptional regulator
MTAAQWSPGAAGPVMERQNADRDLRWQALSVCRAADAELFFGPDLESTAACQAREAKAKRICAGCPVRPECLAYALDLESGTGLGTRGGIYGGLSERERYHLQRHGRLPLRAPSPRRVRRVAAVPVIPDLTDDKIALFRSKTRPGGCGVEWALSVTADGIGLFRSHRDGPRIAAHRIAYKLATGRDPGNDEVIQRCGNRRCLTPECLTAVPHHIPARQQAGQKRQAAA